MKLCAYVRVSTEEQGKSGLGLEAQEEKIRSYCALYGHELVEVLVESASAKNLKRERLQMALKAIVDGRAEGIIVAKLDRLTRSVKDLGTLIEKYFAKKYALVVVSEQLDTQSASGRLVMNLFISVAQWEREAIGERTRDALHAKRQRGEKTGGLVPYGYRIAGYREVDEGGVTRKVPVLEYNRDETFVILQAKAWRENGVGYHTIAECLHDSGYRTRQGCKFTASGVRKILMREGVK